MATKMKKTKCMGTSKNKRAMSGGRGKIGKYTQKFKRSYKRFVNIGDTGDDESRFKKMEEWGRMRNIYNFLKIQNDKYKGSAGTETTAWEKMMDNDKYKSAIRCFEKIDNHILSKGECIPEEDYIKGNTGAPDEAQDNANDVSDDAANVVSGKTGANTGAADVSGKTENTNENAAVETHANAENAAVVDTGAADVSGKTENTNENAAGETDTGAAEVIPVSDAPADVSGKTENTNENAAVETDANAENAAVVDTGAADKVPVAEDSSTTSDVSDAPVGAPAPEPDAPTDADQSGGRSKRKTKSSRRRRGKSMKSKKGCRTRRR
jgi:hypothetical protein